MKYILTVELESDRQLGQQIKSDIINKTEDLLNELLDLYNNGQTYYRVETIILKEK